MQFDSFNRVTVGILALVSFAQIGVEKSVATVLTFDGNFGAISQTYGDHVSATTSGGFSYGLSGEGLTPGITIQYGPNGGSPRTWPSSYGDLTQVLYESVTDTTLQVKFVADAGALVKLHQWDLATYNSSLHPGGLVINGVTVYGANGTPLFNQTNVLVPSVGHIHFSPEGLVDTALTLEIDARNVTTGFGNEDIGLDNVMISQVPEPATAILVTWAAITAGIGGRRLRRRV